MQTVRKCLHCSKSFKTWPSRVKTGKGKFCSLKCRNEDYTKRTKDKSPLWTSVKVKCEICGKFVYRKKSYTKRYKTKHCSQNCYKQTLRKRMLGNKHTLGVEPPNKGKKMPKISGEKNHSWKGDNVGYDGLHIWVRKHLGAPGTCEHCGKSGLKGRSIHWANKSRKYKRDLEDWLRLCVSCHKKYDQKMLK